MKQTNKALLPFDVKTKAMLKVIRQIIYIKMSVAEISKVSKNTMKTKETPDEQLL